ncbi:hypothetical protein FO440_21955 [Mucilaginibacter corticis]|uniref:Uncharacterized protein n=1 Tax=Mucilaginibacter corticis TaxID=2597670 RepID=A0A556M9B3_9SPHI|nr:hypothetical protein [Mucilaginibacter corticis]TSJ36499.1 hypothetical protein FO440_21955 [Mucilaginibacter corticis]
MTPEKQTQEFLSKSFGSKNSLFQFNFYFKTDSLGLMEVIYLLKKQVEFFHFEVDYNGEAQPRIIIASVETLTKNKETNFGIDMIVSDAIYYLTHDVDAIWQLRFQRK